MVELHINRFILHHNGKDYCAGDTVVVDEDYAKQLVADYGTAFTIGSKVNAADVIEQEDEIGMSELPSADITATVVKPKKTRKG